MVSALQITNYKWFQRYTNGETMTKLGPHCLVSIHPMRQVRFSMKLCLSRFEECVYRGEKSFVLWRLVGAQELRQNRLLGAFAAIDTNICSSGERGRRWVGFTLTTSWGTLQAILLWAEAMMVNFNCVIFPGLPSPLPSHSPFSCLGGIHLKSSPLQAQIIHCYAHLF